MDCNFGAWASISLSTSRTDTLAMTSLICISCWVDRVLPQSGRSRSFLFSVQLSFVRGLIYVPRDQAQNVMQVEQTFCHEETRHFLLIDYLVT